MSRTIYLAAGIILLTAVIGIALWLAGFPPPLESHEHDGTIARAILTFPLFWAIMAAGITTVVVIVKRGRFEGGKADTLPTVGILTIPLVALLAQILAPLSSYNVISDRGTNLVFFAALALFFLIVGNFIVTAPPGSRVGFRNKWTLSDPVVWTRVHRFLGRSLVIIVLLVAPLAYLVAPENAQWALIGAVVAVKGLTYLYARNLAQRIALRRSSGAIP